MASRAGLTTGYFAVISPNEIGPFGYGRYIAFYKENRMARLRALCEVGDDSPAAVEWISAEAMQTALRQGKG